MCPSRSVEGYVSGRSLHLFVAQVLKRAHKSGGVVFVKYTPPPMTLSGACGEGVGNPLDVHRCLPEVSASLGRSYARSRAKNQWLP